MVVYDVSRPLREQFDDEAIDTMIRTHVPQLFETFTLEEVLTPKRVINLAREGKVNQETLITYCAHYPLMEYPPGNLVNDILIGPDEGSVKDLYKLTREEYRLMSELLDSLNM